MKSFTLLLSVLIPTLVYAQTAQIMSTEAIAIIKSNLPIVEAGPFRDALYDANAIWYDRDSMGVAMQAGAGSLFGAEFQETGRLGVVNGLIVQSPNNILITSFPWQPKPGATHRSPDVGSAKMFLLPLKPGGGQWPVVVHEAELEGVSSPRPSVTGVSWTFPDGTMFFEPIAVLDSVSNQQYIVIIRVRMRGLRAWSIESLCSFRTASELQVAIRNHRPSWKDNPQLVAFMRHLELAEPTEGRLRDRTPGNRAFKTGPSSAFDVTSKIDNIPPLPRELVADLLDNTVFKPSSGYEWKPGCPAPTTDSDFHIVPKNYDGAFVPIDSVGCARCHEGALVSAQRLNPNSNKRGWVRGNEEGILSWHPFEPSSLTNAPNPNVVLRKRWVDAGIVAVYDPALHPDTVYRRIRNRRVP